MEVSLPEFDNVSQSFHADPDEMFDRSWVTGYPVFRLKLPILGRMLICVKHAACGDMLKDSQRVVCDLAYAGSRKQARILRMLHRSLRLLAQNILVRTAFEYRHIRGLVDQTFLCGGIQAMQPIIDGSRRPAV
jgi:hypothetical protein